MKNRNNQPQMTPHRCRTEDSRITGVNDETTGVDGKTAGVDTNNTTQVDEDSNADKCMWTKTRRRQMWTNDVAVGHALG